MLSRTLLLLVIASCSLAVVSAVPPQPTYDAKVQPASDEPGRAKESIRVPKGMKLDLWAAEPHLANPVIFCLDHKGRVYVAETFRLHQGVTDIRGHMDWLDDDLSCRTVEDRLAMMRKRLGKKFADYEVHHERIRLLEDTTGQGKCDKSTVFAEGFRRPEDGIAAGLLARGDDVYYACIPDLLKLKGGKREVLHTGYGVHVGFIGHDLHGLTVGPDGKLYFSIGDRGLNVKSGGKHFFHPDCGCVLRCNLDGGELEVFATGLRNPQELAFDKYGNLFTGDNNSDGGDKARWVYLVEGGDSGWRIGYQFETSMSNRGPWNTEKLWHPPHKGQPAWIIPPVANLADGPSGLTYYPGVGLPERYNDHFFLADFRGAAVNSGIRSFAVKPKGAGFELTDSHEYLWGVLATDVDFGPDCAMYVSDWVHGWGLTGKGRVWKLTDPDANQTAVAEVKSILADGMSKRSLNEIAKLLEHADRRVRMEAQFALADRGKDAVAVFAGVLKSKHQLAKLHALWGLGQLACRDAGALPEIAAALKDADAEVRAQAAKVLGDGKASASAKELISLLKDESPRVRFFAAQSLGKIKAAEAVAALSDMVRDNADRDLYLRHAGVVGLAGCADRDSLRQMGKDSSPAVRRAVLLAQRRLGSADIATFLDDKDAEIVAEAARAIHDAPVEAAMPALAALSQRQGLNESVGYRALNANFLSGKAENARAVATVAARSVETEALRVEAVRMLGDWDKPGVRDRVMGVARPAMPRPAGLGAEALKPVLADLLSAKDKLCREAAKVAAKLNLREAGPRLFALAAHAGTSPATRAESLRALASLNDDRLVKAVRLCLGVGDPKLRAEAQRQLVRVAPEEGLAMIAKVLESGAPLEKQSAFELLGETKGEKSAALLGTWLDRLLENKIDESARLDLVEAAAKHRGLKPKVARYETERDKASPFGKWRDSLNGGDKEAGRRVFQNKSEVSCLRCHKAAGSGAGEVGPDLTGVGSRQTREYLLESIVSPNKQIAKGFETLNLVLSTGKVRSGILRSEDKKEVRLIDPDGKLFTVPRDQIEERRTGNSAMPEDAVKHLSRREMRDLVEYLASLKEPSKK